MAPGPAAGPAYKASVLGDAPPHCVYETAAADLADAAARTALFSRLGADGRRTLVITEGLLIYLAPDDVRALGTAPFRFAPEESTAFFRPLGWALKEVRWGMDESRRLRREMRGAWLWRILGRLYSAERREGFRRMSGFILLERQE